MAQHNGDGRHMAPQSGEVLPAENRGPAVRSDFTWVDTSWGARSRNERVATTIEGLARGLEICRGYNEQAARYEQSRQQLALTRAQSTLLPLQLERQSAAIYRQIVEAQTDLDRAIHERENAHDDHRIDRLKREERELEVRIRVRRLEAELAGLINPAPAPSPPSGETPEAFRRHWATEQEVRRNRSPADARITAIYAHAAAERRQLSPDELEEIDALGSASDGAESEVRRRAASGLR